MSQSVPPNRPVVCMGCGLPIEGEPYTHMNAENELLLTHDQFCCARALEAQALRLIRRRPCRAAHLLPEAGYDHESHQHDDLMRGVHE